MNDDGTMARGPQLLAFSRRHTLPGGHGRRDRDLPAQQRAGDLRRLALTTRRASGSRARLRRGSARAAAPHRCRRSRARSGRTRLRPVRAHLGRGVHRERPRPLQPELVARAVKEREEREAVSGRAVAEAGPFRSGPARQMSSPPATRIRSARRSRGSAAGERRHDARRAVAPLDADRLIRHLERPACVRRPVGRLVSANCLVERDSGEPGAETRRVLEQLGPAEEGVRVSGEAVAGTEVPGRLRRRAAASSSRPGRGRRGAGRRCGSRARRTAPRRLARSSPPPRASCRGCPTGARSSRSRRWRRSRAPGGRRSRATAEAATRRAGSPRARARSDGGSGAAFAARVGGDVCPVPRRGVDARPRQPVERPDHPRAAQVDASGARRA